MNIRRLKKKAGRDYALAPFEIYAIERLTKEANEGNPPLIYDDKFCIIWSQYGDGNLQVDLQQFILQKDAVYYARPGQSLVLEVADNATGYVVSFAREFVELYQTNAPELFSTSLFNPLVSIPAIKIGSDRIDIMKSIADEMLQEFINYRDLRSEILKGFLKIFIIYLSRQSETEHVTGFWSRKTDLANLFFSHLEKNFATKKLVKEYAEMLAVSPSYLNDSVKEISGHPASHHIQQRIVLEAKRKAVFNGYSMKEAAYDLGFYDPSHFSKYFKNSSGVNFTDFKRGTVGLC
jgi:AraC-like DNA-binding protein